MRTVIPVLVSTLTSLLLQQPKHLRREALMIIINVQNAEELQEELDDCNSVTGGRAKW